MKRETRFTNSNYAKCLIIPFCTLIIMPPVLKKALRKVLLRRKGGLVCSQIILSPLSHLKKLMGGTLKLIVSP